MAAITVEHLTKRYGGVAAVDDLSFEVDEGSVTGFLGRNGAGKTTTLRVLLGLVAPTAGRALIHGRPIADLPAPAATVGSVLDPAFHPGRSGANHLLALSEAARIPRTRVDEVLAEVGLADAAGRRVATYSLGMRQRLAIAAALLGDPAVLLLDEPTNGLDPDGVVWLRRLIRSLGSEGRTVLVSSHVLAEVARTVDEVVIIDRGRLVQQTPIAELAGAHVLRVRTPNPSALREALVQRGIDAVETADGLDVRGATREAVGQAIADINAVVYELRAADASLEELFFAATSTEGDHR